MKSMIWKELRENLRWAALGMLLVGGAMMYALSKHGASLMTEAFLMATLFGGPALAAALGFLQHAFESRGDRRAFLLHRPVSASRIFAAKSVAGLSLYFAAMFVPFLLSV